MFGMTHIGGCMHRFSWIKLLHASESALAPEYCWEPLRTSKHQDASSTQTRNFPLAFKRENWVAPDPEGTKILHWPLAYWVLSLKFSDRWIWLLFCKSLCLCSTCCSTCCRHLSRPVNNVRVTAFLATSQDCSVLCALLVTARWQSIARRQGECKRLIEINSVQCLDAQRRAEGLMNGKEPPALLKHLILDVHMQ